MDPDACYALIQDCMTDMNRAASKQDRVACYAMAYARARDLAEWMRRGGYSPRAWEATRYTAAGAMVSNVLRRGH
jgi:hypothetical protein